MDGCAAGWMVPSRERGEGGAELRHRALPRFEATGVQMLNARNSMAAIPNTSTARRVFCSCHFEKAIGLLSEFSLDSGTLLDQRLFVGELPDQRSKRTLGPVCDDGAHQQRQISKTRPGPRYR
jgi:hypothetical protein